MDNRQAQLQAERYEIEAKFASVNWNRNDFSLSDKMEICRALEENYAAENSVAPCQVTLEYMDGSTFGYQCNGIITLNAYVVEEGTFHTLIRDENGQIMTDESGAPIEKIIPVKGANWATMETVYHEGTHGIQEAQGCLASTYINSQEDYALYRVQKCEREAFATGQLRTLEAIQNYQKHSGNRDVEAISYARSVQANSYQKYHDDAATRYQDTNIERTLDQYISDHDNGVVPETPSESYSAIAEVHEAGIQRTETFDTGHSEEATASEYLGDLRESLSHEGNFDFVALSEDIDVDSNSTSSYIDYDGQEFSRAGAEMGVD